ncbi:MAG: hypothetical protein M3O02_11150 [Acidobacteriota bacterium]|nr:hypothetical protein [Acidobacteriota bacterium]
MTYAVVDIKPVFASSCCSCRARLEGRRLRLYPCSFDDVVWCWRTAEEVWAKKLREVRKILRRGYGEAFRVMLERWVLMLDGSAFFRPEEVATDPDGVSAEDAMFMFESLGVLLPCHAGPRLTDYLQGKAIYGLMEGMWRADAYSGVFWAEDLVANGRMGFAQAQTLFQRKLDGNLLWLFADAITNMEDYR